MSEPIRIYTAGKMSGTSFADQMRWRLALAEGVRRRTDGNIKFLHPPLYYNYVAMSQKTESEIREWELNMLRKCQVMVVDLAEVESSIGTHMELGFANAINMFGNHIFVIGIGSTEGLHPWIRDSLFRVEPDIDSACEYIAKYMTV